jgi:hypothetical protein
MSRSTRGRAGRMCSRVDGVEQRALPRDRAPAFARSVGPGTTIMPVLNGMLNLSFADGVIAFYDAKYTYNFWRPVTAIRAAVTDGNPDTDADPNWLPEVGNTTPDPSYPGAHAVISRAGPRC